MSDKQVHSLKERATVFLIAFAVMLCATIVWTLNRGSSLDDPPSTWNVDGVFYDNIAHHLNAGDGFYVDLQTRSWRANYIATDTVTADEGEYAWLIPVKGTGPTTLRSPAYSFLLSKIYQSFGHRYDVARVFGCVFASLGLALLLAFSVCRWGYMPAIIAGFTLMVDFSVMQSAGTLATESLAILVFAVTFIFIISAYEKPSHFRWAIAGASFAALMLTRGIWNLGLLVMIAGMSVFLIPQIRNRLEFLSAKHLFTFLAIATIFASPWWIRNCMMTEHFTPFGTAGSCGFVGGYCDESLADYGQWQLAPFHRNQLEVQKNVDMDTIDLAKLEYMTGQASLQKTKSWIWGNWTKLPELMLYRGLSHWGLFNPSVPRILQAANVWLVVVGLAGCVFFTGRLRGIFIVVLLLDCLLIMLTWEHLGRYAIPIRPVVHLGYGLAITAVTRKFAARFNKPRQ